MHLYAVRLLPVKSPQIYSLAIARHCLWLCLPLTRSGILSATLLNLVTSHLFSRICSLFIARFCLRQCLPLDLNIKVDVHSSLNTCKGVTISCTEDDIFGESEIRVWPMSCGFTFFEMVRRDWLAHWDLHLIPRRSHSGWDLYSQQSEVLPASKVWTS